MMPDTNADPIQPHIQPTTSTITLANRWDHFLARWGVNRSGHRVEPGLYALGNPTENLPVFVTANYTLGFDALRSALAGVDGYILVLDTQGINVWCVAGKGTFGTDELVHRIEATRLHDVVRHRVLILPQLGAAGVIAHEVKKRSGFKVEYGPVRAADLPEYLKTHRATPEMRRVRFALRDRLILIPVEKEQQTMTKAMKVKVDQELNLKGEVCPYTFVKTKLALEMMESGQILRVIVDHLPAVENVPRSVKNEGHEVLKVGQVNDTDWEIVIQKT